MPHDASVASLTAIERQMVFYLGRDILPAYMIRERMENNYGEEQGEMKWRNGSSAKKDQPGYSSVMTSGDKGTGFHPGDGFTRPGGEASEVHVVPF